MYSSTSAVSVTRNVAGNAAIYIGTILNTNGVANSFGVGEVYITGYSSGKFKQTIGETSNISNITTLDGAYQTLTAGLSRSTNPITSISLIPGSGSFVANSTFTLYGILKPGNRPKAVGGEITYDDKYWYHTFKTTGASTFIPNQDLGGECLVIAGGGSGGYGSPGGGGAGGVLAGVGTFLRGNSYTVTVGAGGIFPANPNTIGNSGQNSSISGNGFQTITAIGGGAGGIGAGSGVNGGSGGGSGEAQPTTFGFGTYGQGYDGNTNNGGGGGAGGPGARGYGQNAGAARTGVGGIGTSAYTFWGITTGTGQNVSNLVYYAGGGAGYGSAAGGAIVFPVAGGLGGGGQTQASGTANTGGGGGADGGSGGSGVVIIRYPA